MQHHLFAYPDRFFVEVSAWIAYIPTILGVISWRVVLFPPPFPADPQLTTPDALGAAIRAARTASGLTLEEAALAVSVAKQTLGDLEAGKPTVGLGIALRVAKALGVSLFIAPAVDTGTIAQRIREARE